MKVVLITLGSILVILPVIFLLYYLSPLRTLTLFAANKHISGKIYDCVTNEPIENAQVSITGIGWGIRDNVLVWDKAYFVNDTTDQTGLYSLKYNLGTELTAKKDGYLEAYYYSSAGENIDIGLLSETQAKDKNERTFQCKLSSECYKEVVKDGVEIGWDSCANPNYQP